MKLFEIKQFMADNNLDISRADTFVEGGMSKQGARITMGADESALYGLMDEKYIPVLFCINKEQYKLLSSGVTDLEKLKAVEK